MEPGDVRAGRGEAQPSGRSPTAAWPGLTLCLRKFPAESPGQKLWSRMSECCPTATRSQVGGWVSPQDTNGSSGLGAGVQTEGPG